MLCGISGETPTEPVISTKTGVVFEKRLIEQYIKDHGKEPGTNEDLTTADLLPVRTARVVPPRPPKLTSIPALLGVFQNEWDALALETYRLQEELANTRQELSTALYQHDAAVRVIARLTRERNEAREALANITVSAGGSGAAAQGDDEMAIDSVETLPEEVVARVDTTMKSLSKSRKKRPVPAGWVTGEQVSAFSARTTTPVPVPNTTTVAIEGDYAAVSGLEGEAAIYAVDADKVERQVPVGEPVTDSAWKDSKLVFSTAKGSVKVYDSGSEVASFSEHAGAATGVSVHPSGDLVASVGADKSVVIYDLTTSQRVGRSYADTALTTCAFHPDGHLLGIGTLSGDIKLYMTNTLEAAATFSLGAPVQSIVFSENGFWVAATAKGQSTVTVFDLRKEGDAAVAKIIETGGSVAALAWDYTGQFLATAGPTGITVQQYAKSAKSWSEPFRNATPAVTLAWGPSGQRLVVANGEGVVTVFGTKEDE